MAKWHSPRKKLKKSERSRKKPKKDFLLEHENQKRIQKAAEKEIEFKRKTGKTEKKTPVQVRRSERLAKKREEI